MTAPVDRIPRFNEIKTKPVVGEIRMSNDGTRRRIFDGRFWQYLCAGDLHCRVQARHSCRIHKKRVSTSDLSKTTPVQRSSLTNFDSIHSDQSSIKCRTRSRTVVTQKIEEAAKPTEQNEIQTRHGRRVKCNGFFWKHLCTEKKTPLYKRQRISLSDVSQMKTNSDRPIRRSSPIAPTRLRRRQVTTQGENSVPKRKSDQKRRRVSTGSITISIGPNDCCAVNSESSTKENDDLNLSMKSDSMETSSHSVEIPLRSPQTFPSHESTNSTLFEQFGTIIKKEIDEDLPTIQLNLIEDRCESLQDFIRLEELREKEFQLDCQRIGYRLAKIDDYLNEIPSISV